MLDTGYNHKYVYILGQGPVFDLFGYFIRRKLRCVNKWLNEYVSTDVEDRAQRVIRLAFMRAKLYRAMCLSCWSITPEHFRILLNNKNDRDWNSHWHDHPAFRGFAFMNNNNDDNNDTMISNYSRKKVMQNVKRSYNLFLSPFIHTFTDFATKARERDTKNVYFISRERDIVRYISLRILGGSDRKLALIVNCQNYITHCINNDTELIRIFINIPIVATSYSCQIYQITGCLQSKAIEFGSFVPDRLVHELGHSVYENKHHKMCIEEYDCNGSLLHKQDYYKSVLISQGNLIVDDEGACLC